MKHESGASIELSFTDDGRPAFKLLNGEKGGVVISVDEYGGNIFVMAKDNTARIEIIVGSDDCGYLFSGSREQREALVPLPGAPVVGRSTRRKS